MVDRSFSEVELRTMLEHSKAYREDVVEGRWVVEARQRREDWEIIVEPDYDEEILVVITAYPVGRVWQP